MVEILETIKELTESLVSETISKSDKEIILEELDNIQDDYADIEPINTTIAFVKTFYKEDSLKGSVEAAIKRLLSEEVETLVHLSDLGLKYTDLPFEGIADIVGDKNLEVTSSHPLFKTIKGDIDNLLSIYITDDEKQMLYNSLENLEFTSVSHSFIYSLIIINSETYILGVNKRDNVVLVCTIKPLLNRYKIKNKRKLDRITYKGTVFPEYTGVDMHKNKESGVVIDREFMMGASMFLENLGVRLN